MYLYILSCNNGTTYTGITHNLWKRFDEHKKGFGANYTRMHGVGRILYVEYYKSERDARLREIEIKSWNLSSKINLINGTLINPISVRVKNPVTRGWEKLASEEYVPAIFPSQHFNRIVEDSNFIRRKTFWF